MYTENTSDMWHISGYPMRKCCITSIFTTGLKYSNDTMFKVLCKELLPTNLSQEVMIKVINYQLVTIAVTNNSNNNKNININLKNVMIRQMKVLR